MDISEWQQALWGRACQTHERPICFLARGRISECETVVPPSGWPWHWQLLLRRRPRSRHRRSPRCQQRRSEEHTSELQSPCNLVCRLLLEKKKIPTTAYACVRP